MTSPARLYVLVVAVLVFFLSWAAIAANPWAAEAESASADPRLAALAAREQRLQERASEVQRILDQRWADHRVALAKRKREIAAARKAHAKDVRAAERLQAELDAQTSEPVAPPTVRVVTLPPVTQSRSS
ncbi:MAG: hypothetical protein R3C15_07750 [Thermoleophilia bacterium]